MHIICEKTRSSLDQKFDWGGVVAMLIAAALGATAIKVITAPDDKFLDPWGAPQPDDMALHAGLGWCMKSA